jgi:hypothetical protein
MFLVQSIQSGQIRQKINILTRGIIKNKKRENHLLIVLSSEMQQIAK